ncbi:AMP-dependent synthetase/ligase [Gulosibacter sp. ACHW.36C]|uniref:AMP-dependent synthetase/ligase n=1 Tax=Gulosibacter sediminis TaxID=1729695 RepID=A0ABY4N2L6_9MICO|nr:AMP-dependent synthetase/ligase [Gulosibacter sediminis]UQN15758.1 AMP-dependent synthetase/ligase [Gulosibacter sediminis]
MTETRNTAHVEGLGTFEPSDTLTTMLRRRVAAGRDSVFAEHRVDGTFTPITIGQLDDDVRALARGLMAAGVQTGDAVGIMAGTRYEWTVADFAVLAVGALVVPIYHTSSAEQLVWMCTDADIRTVIVETEDHAALAEGVRADTALERIIVIDRGDLDGLVAEGVEAEIGDDELDARAASVGLEDLASIVYTSGTTGRPKGVELTHHNWLAHVINGVSEPGLGEVVLPNDAGVAKRTLLFLPLAHVYGRFAQFLCVHSKSVLGYAPNTKNLVTDLQAFEPTWLIAVPRVFETVYNAADAKAGKGVKLRLFRWAVDVAVAYSEALDRGRPNVALRARHSLADRLVLGKLREVMGGKVDYAISGGAALSLRHAHFFRGLGVTIMEGYGATETTAPASVNRPGRIKVGTVGAPYPGMSLAVADDGEVLIKGPSLFRGYHNNAEATAEAIDGEGWLRTGDLGELDADGYLRISGRKKEILVTAGGKNVQPAVLENALRSHPLIGEIMVVGEGKPFIGALVALDEAMLPGWLENHDIAPLTLEQARTNDAVRATLQEAIDRANEHVSRAESIRKFEIVPRMFSEDRGEVSASTKLIRRVVEVNFAESMAKIYDRK